MNVSQLPTETQWRRSTCSPRCQRLLVQVVGERHPRWWEEHHLDDHIDAALAGHASTTAPAALSWGRLVVSPKLMAAWLDGQPLNLTALERGLLVYLAERSGQVCRSADIIRNVWGAEYASPSTTWRWEKSAPEHHLLRVTMHRLRTKLGDAKRLLQTSPAIGYWMPEAGAVDLDALPPILQRDSGTIGSLQHQMHVCLKDADGQWVLIETLIRKFRLSEGTGHLRTDRDIRKSLRSMDRRGLFAIEVRYQGDAIMAARVRTDGAS